MAERETSFAKNVQLDSYKQSLLDRAERLGVTFNNASSNEAKQSQGDKQGSSMVEKDQPKHVNRPPEEMAKAADRQAYAKGMRNDDKAAKTKQAMDSERAKRLIEKAKAEQQNKDQNNNGMKNSM